jgi:hypothetical protein
MTSLPSCKRLMMSIGPQPDPLVPMSALRDQRSMNVTSLALWRATLHRIRRIGCRRRHRGSSSAGCRTGSDSCGRRGRSTSGQSPTARDRTRRRNPPRNGVCVYKEPAIIVREPDTTMQPTPQDIQLMSKHRVLSFKPQLRLEWKGQDGQHETEQPDHSASLCDSITSSTRIRFSVHTGTGRTASRPKTERPARSAIRPLEDNWAP